jgi:hypothetical protein
MAIWAAWTAGKINASILKWAECVGGVNAVQAPQKPRVRQKIRPWIGTMLWYVQAAEMC